MGLYDDDAVTGGDQNNHAYFHAKAYSQALEDALAAKQPEGAIRVLCERGIAACDEALETFPGHADLQAWRERLSHIHGRCDKTKQAWFPDNFPWKHDDFRKLWVSVHWTRCARDHGDWQTVYEQSFRAASGWRYNLGNTPKKFPEALQRWIDEAVVEMTALRQEATAKR